MAVSISISITQNSQSIANNTSNVTVKVNASWTYGSYNQLQKSGWLTIDGTKYTFTSDFNYNQKTSGSETLFTKTVNVKHNSDGTKKLSCSASYTSGVSSGTVTASASKTLTTIPRKSTLSVGNGTLGTKQTLTVTKQATSFTHTIVAKCGSSSSTVCTKSSSTSISFTPPLSWASNNTTGTSVSVTYTITTYNGSTSVGSNTYTKTCSIPSSVKPSCTISVSDATNHFATYGAYIKGYSKFKITVSPKLAYNSPIASYKTTANGSTYTSASFTTGVLKSSGTLNVSATVTDKRGRTSSAATKSVTVLNYSPPTIPEFKVGRCDSDGTANDQGDHVKVNFLYSITDLNSKNGSTCTLQYKKTSESTFTTPSDFSSTKGTYGEYIFEADTGSSYDVKITVKDNLSTTTKSTSVSTAFTIMHWKANGLGMGIGKISEEDDVLDIGFQTRFTGGLLYPVLASGTDLDTVLTPGMYVGENISNNTYANAPIASGTFTLEVMSSGPNSQVKQIFTQCDKTKGYVYERTYYGGTWQDSWYGKWYPATLSDKFTNYYDSGSEAPKYRRVGSIVEIRGTVKPASDIAYSTDYTTIFTLPTGYRPDTSVFTLCQGSGHCIWLLKIDTNGDVGFTRYRNGNEGLTATNTYWLPFQCTFTVG